ncbi:serine/threonine protein kinase [Lentzea atacamensis]|uniref:non-specific serine/threonine protein kinase n=1 Tax=Lentzea atacamensis TaxID=531938 RepID=A0A316HSF9_9PSEU|nr:serine/threonine-protein kinase [Lentzea atacamensis]PWK83625.1 serine/threonine protein kinase [Lentzea atacamensis]
MTEELPEIPGFRYARPLGKNVHLYRSPDGEVAVKLLADPPRAGEIRTVLGLGHPGIVVVHRAGRTRAGLLYLVMKHYSNGDLAALAPLPVERVLDIGLQIADALQAAHRAGVVHRDVKPANVLLDEAGNACLTDFGVLGRDRLPWTAPEVITSGFYSVRADVFSLGATLWHLLVGHSPFVLPRGDNSHAALEQRILHGSPPPTGRAPRPLELLLRQAMTADPAVRPASAEAFALRLREIYHETAPAGSTVDAVVTPADPRPRRRSRWPVYASAAAVAAGVVGTSGVLWLKDDSLPQQNPVAQPQNAGAEAGPSPKVTVSVTRVNRETLRFSWTYQSPLAGDTFAWRTNDDLKSGTVETPSVDLYAPGALCVQVRVVRADGSNASDQTWSPEGCGF